MKKSYVYGLLTLLFFGAGAYTWKVTTTGRNVSTDDETRRSAGFAARGTIAIVGGTPITREHVDWEYSLHTNGLLDQEADLTPIPHLGERINDEMSTLKEQLASNIIERKLLYKFIEQDQKFDLANSARFVDCLKEWQAATEDEQVDKADPKESQNLKSMLCERSIINQYLDDRIFADLTITDEEVVEYFKNHANEFKQPTRVIIRQVVLPSEKEAKRAQARINRSNFARIAKEVSIAPESEQGGLVGPFAKGQMPRVFEIAFRMRRGQISRILKSTYGFHLIMLEKKLKKVDISLPEATPRIKEILIKKKKEGAYEKWVELALNTVKVSSPKPLW